LFWKNTILGDILGDFSEKDLVTLKTTRFIFLRHTDFVKVVLENKEAIRPGWLDFNGLITRAAIWGRFGKLVSAVIYG
jgi:hypothetical protein